MKILALDTSTELCSAALLVGTETRERAVLAGNRHSELLLPMVRELLAEAGMGLADLDGLAFGQGPGSFTGLRIGCGVVQGLAFGADRPVVAVGSLEALAFGVDAEAVLACIDARMHEVYVAAYRRVSGGVSEVLAPQVLAPGAVALPAGGPWVGCGPGFAAYPQLLAGQVQSVLADHFPRAAAVARLAAPRLAAGAGVAAEAAEPVYVRDKVALKISER